LLVTHTNHLFISSYAGDLEVKVAFGAISAGITKIQV